MARPGNETDEQPAGSGFHQLSPEVVDAVQREQGRSGLTKDVQEDHVIVAPRTATTLREMAVHEIWLLNPGSADIIGIDTAGSVPDIRKKEREGERKRREAKPPGKPEAKKPAEPAKPPEKKTASGPGTFKKNDGTYNELGYTIIGGNPSMRSSLDKMIRTNFTKKELSTTKGLVIEIGSGGNAKSGASGVYLDNAAPVATASGGLKKNRIVSKKAAYIDGMQHYMKIGKAWVDGDVITHEMIHHIRAERLRNHSPKTDITAKQAEALFFDHDREESATDLETIGRHNLFEDEFGRIDRPSPAGYYQYVANRGSTGGDINKLERQDRALLTLFKVHDAETIDKAKQAGIVADVKLRSSGLRGKQIRERVAERYDDTNMGQSRKGEANRFVGRSEEVDQYFAALDDDGKPISKIHIRSAVAKPADAQAIDALRSVAPATASVVQYHDGKPEVIDAGTKTVAPVDAGTVTDRTVKKPARSRAPKMLRSNARTGAGPLGREGRDPRPTRRRKKRSRRNR